MPRDPRVSIITRTLGRACLAEAGASVAAQTFRPIEWVVVDAEGSGIVPPAAGRADVAVVSTGQPMRRSRAANAGFDAARGGRFLLLDDDDLIMPDHVERLSRALDEGGGMALAYSDVAVWTADGVASGVMDIRFAPLVITRQNMFAPNAALFDADLVRSQGCRMDEGLEFCEDWDLWCQVAALTAFRRVPGATAIYRTHLSQSGVGGSADPVQESRRLRDVATIRERFRPWREHYEDRIATARAWARDRVAAGDYDGGLSAWQSVTDQDPYDVDAVLRCAEAAFAARRPDRARTILHDALDRLPGDDVLLRNLAIIEGTLRELAQPGGRAAHGA